ncbi:soluble lytic murein transglycosylase [Litorimonas taeanensis]|uniref:Soluble lytic murein transglycosylase n=1 Tax=Litorimonas taeanensis TaxID=568099 RepID=A0A420WKD8_9PROT|nr:lytic transglycosylase domain-containing protein [Litorimonas taeanensis]RKQ71460.1 soluble lytic murein transglycosylase [Litorimonas taeanensis]
MQILRMPHSCLLRHQASIAFTTFVKAIQSLSANCVLIGALLSFGLPQTVFASNVPSPRLKPAPPALSQYLNDNDARNLRKAVAAAKRGSWSEYINLHNKVRDPLARDLLTWVRATRDPNAPQETLNIAAQRLSDWPRQTTIRAKAEANLFDRPIPPRATIEWFKGEDPVSGEGRMALARANFAIGNNEVGDMWLRSAWRDSKLTRDRQKTVFGEFKTKLKPDDHAIRADHLIWNGRYHLTKAQALLPHMASNERKLMDARIRVATNKSGMDAAINAVPVKYKNDAGLLYERAKWRRKRKTKDYALPVYKSVKTAPTNIQGRKALWREEKLMAYWLISEKRYKEAYQLAINHGFERGTEFAEAEFLSGWLALQKLNNRPVAQQHFKNLAETVTTPVSLARGYYWLGRASIGAERAIAFQQAAQYQNTFYGHLALTEMSDATPTLNLPPENDFSFSEAQLNADPRVRAMKLLAEIGDEQLYSQFSFHLDDVVESIEELSALSKISKDYGYMRPSLRAAKQASRFQTMLTNSGYPIIQVIENMPNDFEKAFVYAIARQETEFETNAVSSARAYGLMQMINSTAKYTARKHRIPYSQSRLLSDSDYAATLGAHHLNDLLEQWDGSYILAAVSYNAGPHRAKQWIKTYGDPRKGDIDPIDWIESTPFSETRNYVQRVMENMQVYRARRNGDSHPLYIERDLRFGQQ